MNEPSGGEGASRSGTVDLSFDNHVAVVTLNSPPHNFLAVPMITDLADILTSLRGKCRAAVLASVGKSFCAGANFRSGNSPDPSSAGSFEATTAAFYEQALRIFGTEVPLVAAIQGGAIGAGFGLALACDVRVIGKDGWFQVNFVRLGIHPGFALSFTLPRLVGVGRAEELLLTARRVDESEATRIGLCEVATHENVLDAALEVAREIAMGSPSAVAATRATLRAGLVDAARETMKHELKEQSTLAGTPDAREGVLALLEKRAPIFEEISDG